MPKQTQARYAAIYTTVLGIVWLGLFPLLSGFTYSHITYDKWVISICLGAISAVGALVFAAQKGRFDWGNPVRIAALAYFLLVGLSALWGSDCGQLNADGELVVVVGSGRYEGLITNLFYLLTFLSLSIARPNLRHIAIGAAAGLLLFSVVVYLQYAGINALGLYPGSYSIRTKYEFQGTIGNIDMVSGYVMIVTPVLMGAFLLDRHPVSWAFLPGSLLGVMLELMMEVQSGLIATALTLVMCLYLAMVRPDTRARLFLLLSGVLICYAIRQAIGLPWLDGTKDVCLRPLSMTGIAALIAGALLPGLAILFARHPLRRIHPALAAGILLALFVIVILVVALTPMEPSGSAIYELHELLNGRPKDEYGSWRLGVWRHSLHLTEGRLLNGGGPDTFRALMKTHLATEGAHLGENFDNPHNMYLWILVDCGLPALLAFIALLALAVIRCLRRGGAAGVMVALGVIAYAVQGFFSFSICIVTPMFWALLGMACFPFEAVQERKDPLGQYES